MKKLLLAAGLAACIAFVSGCASTGATSASSASSAATTATATAAADPVQQAAEKFQDAVLFACDVIQPTIQPFALLLNATPAVATFNGDFALACSINSTLNLTSISSLIGSSITAAQQAVSGIPSLSASDQALINAALGAFQGSLKLALANYNTALAAAPTTAATTASSTATPAAAAPAAASTPLAGAPLQ